MRIRTQFIFSMAVFGVVVAAVSASVIVTGQEVERLNRQLGIASSIQRDASELSYLWNDYIVYRESQQRARWESKFASFADDVSRLDTGSPEQRVIVDSIKANQQRLKAVFAEVAATLEQPSQARDPGTGQAFVEVSWSRMAVQDQGIFFDASRLSQMLRDQVDELRQQNIALVVALLGVFGAYFLTNYLIFYRRALRSMAELEAGTRIIGSGDLGFTIGVKRDDEIGDLSRAFNLMTASLRGVTASKAELEREVDERKKAEHMANQQKAIQEGINRILEAALTCDTEEALGRTCLAVAERLTGSKFGFVGEINAEGCLDDIAISDPGWDACRMDPPTGHRKLPTSLEVHGIYGRVLLDGKGFSTNDPASHPDSVGTPGGHPHLEAFLGVPLAHGGKTVGIVAVGNREGGYSNEELAALEALAPAIVQVFMHKRAEAERGRLLQAEQEARALAETAVKLRDEFISIAAHELKTPVTSLQGFAQVMLRELGKTGGVDPTRLSRSMERIEQQSRRLAKLTEQLLNLSRLQSGKLVLSVEQADLSALARGVVTSIQHTNPARTLEFRDGEPAPARVDPLRIEQVVTNLLDNALKFSPANSPVEVTVEMGDPEWVMVAVRDHGIGIPEEKRERIFERFYQVHPERHYGGMGIGLSISRQIVEMHGGTIKVEAPEDGGSRFIIRLPANGVAASSPPGVGHDGQAPDPDRGRR